MNVSALNRVDTNGNILYNIYDGLNRIIRTSNSLDNTCFDYTYDSAGKLVRVNNTEYKYNTFGELISQKEGNIEQKYSYNSLGLRTEYSVENCGVVQMNQNYTYDAFGRLSAVTSPLGRQSYTYDRAGRLVSTYGDTSKIGTQYSYFPSGNIELQIQIVGGKITDEVRYEYDRNGSRTLEKSFDGEKRYTYDSRNRLHEVIDGGILSVYSYDDFGNISAVDYFSGNVSSSTKYVYDANNRLTESFEDNFRTEYTYDKQGNLICRKNDIGRTDYFYNGFNKMTGVSGENLTAEYTYDYSGLRTSKTVNGVFTQLVNDGQNVSAQYVDGRVNCFYRGISLIGYTDSDSNANFYQFNAHGDVISVLDCFGNTVHNYDYNEFGKQKESAENLFLPRYGMKADTNPFRYCGEYQDLCSGLIYLRNRYYDPSIGRFISEDPARDGLNWYVYCGNNPVNYIDPNGLSGIKTDGTYYITHPLDKELLKLKQEYGSATPKRQAQIAVEAQNIRNSGTEGVDWSVRADRTLNYYMIDTDVTKKLNDVIKSSESENWWKRFGEVTPVTNAARYVDFALMVRPGGKYDLKSKSEWQGKEHFIYTGEIIWYDEPGNILYGHLGKVMGFEDVILKSAGGAVQITTGTSSWSYVSSYFDDPRDQKAIQKGIDIFKNTHSWIWW